MFIFDICLLFKVMAVFVNTRIKTIFTIKIKIEFKLLHSVHTIFTLNSDPCPNQFHENRQSCFAKKNNGKIVLHVYHEVPFPNCPV